MRHLVRRQVPMERRQFDRQLTAMTFARMIAYICLGVAYSLFRISTVQTPINIDNSLQYATYSFIGSLAGSLGYLNYVVRGFFSIASIVRI